MDYKCVYLEMTHEAMVQKSVMQLRSLNELQESQYVLKTSNTIYLLPV